MPVVELSAKGYTSLEQLRYYANYANI